MGLALTVVENTCSHICPLVDRLDDANFNLVTAAKRSEERAHGLEEALEYWVDTAAMEAERRREAEKTANSLREEVLRLNNVVSELRDGLDSISDSLGKLGE